MTVTPVTVGTSTHDPVTPEFAARLATVARITAAARAELCQRPDELSLRAVARRAGVDPRVISRYVTTSDQLIANVLFEIAHDAHDAIGPALAAAAGTGCRQRMLALAHAYRAWAGANPADFWVLHGPRVRGVVDHDAAARAMTWFYGPAIEIYGQGLTDGEVDVRGLARRDRTSGLVRDSLRAAARGLDPRMTSAFLALSTGLHGYLMLEACGQVGTVFADLDRAFDAHMRGLFDAAGIA